MRLSEETMVKLARSGDEQAIKVLRAAEEAAHKDLTDTEFYYQEGPGIFYKVNGTITPNRIQMVG